MHYEEGLLSAFSAAGSSVADATGETNEVKVGDEPFRSIRAHIEVTGGTDGQPVVVQLATSTDGTNWETQNFTTVSVDAGGTGVTEIVEELVDLTAVNYVRVDSVDNQGSSEATVDAKLGYSHG